MTSYRAVQERAESQIQKLTDFSGLPKALVANIVMYVRMLVRPGTEDIDELVFIAQLSKRFNLSSTFILHLMFDVNKPKKTPHMTIDQFCKCLCVFLCDKFEERVNFVFRCYDLNGDQFISRSEVYTLLRPCVAATEAEEQDIEDTLKELMDIVFWATDVDKNERIELSEFSDMAKRDSMFLEFLGQVLPASDHVEKFRKLLEHKTPSEVRKVFFRERCFLLQDMPPNEMQNLYPIILDLP